VLVVGEGEVLVILPLIGAGVGGAEVLLFAVFTMLMTCLQL
jgi:hypothetical protein